MKINRLFINLKSCKKFFVFVLSLRLLPFVQSIYSVNNFENDNHTSDLSTLESIQNDVYNRDHFLNHINQLNSNHGNRLNNYPQFRFNKSSYVDRPTNIITKRIALLANLFGKSDSEEDKKSSENQTDIKSSELKKENSTFIENLNKNSNQSNLENQSNYLKNHHQNDKETETLNTLLNFSKNYENWQDHFKNHHALNNHRQDFINLLHLNNTNFSDLLSTSPQNSTGEQDQAKSKNVFMFSPETYPGKSLLVENNQYGFKPNNLISSLLANNDHDYYPRSNQGETITEASDLNSEYDEESNKDEEDDKQIDNRNENNRRKYLKNRIRSNGHHRPKFGRNKMRKHFDEFGRNNSQNSGFRPISIDKLLKEQSQISASTGVKRNTVTKNSKQASDTNESNGTSKVKRVNSTTTSDTEYNQLSVSNQPFVFKPHAYKFPTNNYGKRLVNEILNSQPNRKQNLVSSNNNKNVVINTATPTIESTSTATAIDQLDDENNEQIKEDILSEHDKQLITDKTKDLFEKNDDSSDLQLNDYETNKDSDLKNNNDLINTQLSYNQAIDANLLNQQQQIANQAELDSSENDENENDLNNSIIQSVNQTKESDLDSSNKAKILINELNKASKQDKNQASSKSKQQNKKTSWKQLNSNYKHYKIYDKYSKLNGLNGLNGLNPNFNFDQNYPMNSYLSNENFKINLSSGKSDLEDEITMNNLIPYPTPQYNKQSSFSNLYYPYIKKKPYYSNYPSYGFSMNPLNGMLFDKLNIPLDNYSPVEKLPPLNGPIKGLDKNNLDNKFYNLDNKLHHLNSKYSLNSLAPPYNLPLPLEGKYYEPKGHYDSKYHSIGNWQSGLAGFLLGVVPFSLMMASMVPTISAISSGGAAAAALGRRRRSVGESSDFEKMQDGTVNPIESSIENSDCLIRLSKIIESINNLIQVKELPNQMDTKTYFDRLIELQRQCEFNISLPIDFNERIKKFLSFKTDKHDKKWRKESNSYYLYDLNNGKINWLDSIFSFFSSLLSSNDYDYQFRLNNTDSHDRVDYHTSANNDQVFSIFHFREMKCLQETVCKVLLSPNFKKSLFSNVASILANITPKKLANKYGLNIIVDGITTSRCVAHRSYCQN